MPGELHHMAVLQAIHMEGYARPLLQFYAEKQRNETHNGDREGHKGIRVSNSAAHHGDALLLRVLVLVLLRVRLRVRHVLPRVRRHRRPAVAPVLHYLKTDNIELNKREVPQAKYEKLPCTH